MSELTRFSTMWDEYPMGTADEVKARIGGAVNAAWITNTCVVRLSRSLNYAGFPLPVRHPTLATLKGGDDKRYGFRVRELKAYLRAVYGPPDVTHAYEGDGGGDVPVEILKKKGIICFDVTGWSDASGHFDLWDGTACRNHAYFELASRVHLWLVSDGPSQSVAQSAGAARDLAPPSIGASVGAGGVNKPEDVRVVQQLLASRGLYKGAIDGLVGPATIDAIKAFQRGFVTFPDGRVDVRGRTLRELAGY